MRDHNTNIRVAMLTTLVIGFGLLAGRPVSHLLAPQAELRRPVTESVTSSVVKPKRHSSAIVTAELSDTLIYAGQPIGTSQTEDVWYLDIGRFTAFDNHGEYQRDARGPIHDRLVSEMPSTIDPSRMKVTIDRIVAHYPLSGRRLIREPLQHLQAPGDWADWQDYEDAKFLAARDLPKRPPELRGH